ncbi:MAG: aminomethyl transferase family protein [Chloroflexi bacterium]|nr:aminomethyl transferase family protein [Chloroflexota bacterium]
MNNLLERQQQLGARFFEREGVMLARDFGDVRAEYAALRNDAGIFHRADCGVLRVEGRDRATWLHKLVTANIQAMRVNDAVYGLLLNAKGHIVADFTARVQSDSILLFTGKRAHQTLFANLRRAIFREKVSLTDASESFTIFSFQGPRAHEFQSLISNLQSLATHARQATTFDCLIPTEHARATWDALIAQGARPVGFDAINSARVEDAIAWFGDDFDATMLAPEARLDPFIAEDKGCYTGQEVIARIKNRGHVNRVLVQLQLATDQLPNRGDKIFADEKEIGWITSAVWSFARNAPLAFGYTRREIATDGARVQIVSGADGLPAIIVAGEPPAATASV